MDKQKNSKLGSLAMLLAALIICVGSVPGEGEKGDDGAPVVPPVASAEATAQGQAAVPSLAKDPKNLTPEERIKAAKVPPPGKVCETDPDEAERVARLQRDERNQAFVGLAAYTITEALRISGAEWESRPQRMLDEVNGELRQVAGEPEVQAQGGAHATPVPMLLTHDACVSYANLDDSVCLEKAWVDGEWVEKDPMMRDLCLAWIEFRTIKATTFEECATRGKNTRWLPMCHALVTNRPELCDNTSLKSNNPMEQMRDLFACKWSFARFKEGLTGCGKDFDPDACTTSMFVQGLGHGPAVCDSLAKASEDWSDPRYAPMVETCRAIYTEDASRCPADPVAEGGPPARYVVDGVLTGGEDGVMAQVAGVSNIPALCHVTMRVVRDGKEYLRRSATVGLRAFQANVTHRESLPVQVDPVRDSLELGSMCVPSTNWLRSKRPTVKGAH